MTEVWILDDDAELCRLIEDLLADNHWTIRSFGDPSSFETALAIAAPDLLVLDQMLPLKPGTQVLAGLRHAGHRFPVLMLSALGAPTDRVRGLEMGAEDYLTKPFLPRELELRIANLLRQAQGTQPIPRTGETYRIAALQFEPAEQLVNGPDGQSERLSRGETAMLLAFCKAPGLVLSREHLAKACGTLVDTSNSRSMDVRISKLRRRLDALAFGGDPHASSLIEAVRGRGYRISASVVSSGLA